MSREQIATEESYRLDETLARYARAGLANRTAFQELKVVLARFHEQGIECLLLKGADLIPRLYGVLGARTMADVDLLVHEADLPVIDSVLTGLAYRPHIDGNPAYVDPEQKLDLDIITHIWYMDDPAIVWQRAVQRAMDGVPVKGMGTNDLLLYLTAYAVIHRGCLAGPYGRDLALLLEKETVDWDFVVAETSRFHLKIAMYHGLSFVVRQYAGVPIPDHVLRSLAPSTLSERLWYWFFQKLVTDKPVAELGHLLLFLTQPGLKKWRWLKERFFPSAPFLRYRYGHRWKAHPLMTRLFRPFYLMSQALRLSLRILGLLLKRPT